MNTNFVLNQGSAITVNFAENQSTPGRIDIFMDGLLIAWLSSDGKMTRSILHPGNAVVLAQKNELETKGVVFDTILNGVFVISTADLQEL